MSCASMCQYTCVCVSVGDQDLESLLAAFDEERQLMGERHAAAEARATQLQAQVRGCLGLYWANS